MKAICGADCSQCELWKKTCKGCKESNGCPFGKKCWIAKYIEVGGEDNFQELKKQLMNELNALNIDGMPPVEELYPLHGSYVNLEYPLPSGEKKKILDDNESYLGTQVECEFNDVEYKKCFGIVANMDFILVCEYEEYGLNPEIIVYKKR